MGTEHWVVRSGYLVVCTNNTSTPPLLQNTPSRDTMLVYLIIQHRINTSYQPSIRTHPDEIHPDEIPFQLHLSPHLLNPPSALLNNTSHLTSLSQPYSTILLISLSQSTLTSPLQPTLTSPHLTFSTHPHSPCHPYLLNPPSAPSTTSTCKS